MATRGGRYQGHCDKKGLISQPNLNARACANVSSVFSEPPNRVFVVVEGRREGHWVRDLGPRASFPSKIKTIKRSDQPPHRDQRTLTIPRPLRSQICGVRLWVGAENRPEIGHHRARTGGKFRRGQVEPQMKAIGPLVTIAVPIEISGKAPRAHFSPETLTPNPRGGFPPPRVVWDPNGS